MATQSVWQVLELKNTDHPFEDVELGRIVMDEPRVILEQDLGNKDAYCGYVDRLFHKMYASFGENAGKHQLLLVPLSGDGERLGSGRG